MILTERYLLKPLTVDDVTERYLGWFAAPGSEHIASARSIVSMSDLRAYVAERESRDDVLFLGIFDRASGVHLGNVKFEPVNEEESYATCGIFIGEVEARGNGTAGEAITAAAQWLNANRGIKQILLGVHVDNYPAVRAYRKIGFREDHPPHLPEHPDIVWMTLDIA